MKRLHLLVALAIVFLASTAAFPADPDVNPDYSMHSVVAYVMDYSGTYGGFMCRGWGNLRVVKIKLAGLGVHTGLHYSSRYRYYWGILTPKQTKKLRKMLRRGKTYIRATVWTYNGDTRTIGYARLVPR